jgi:mannose-6-phosphate isomerase-like protein (cupin superfamily)
MTATHSAIVRGPDDGKRLAVMGNEMRFKVVSADSGGRLLIIDYTAPAHFPGPPPHFHAHTDEAYYVLEGMLTVRLEEGDVTAGPGATLFVPRMVPHTFANRQDVPLRYLVIMTPSGFEGYFEELAALVEGGHALGPDVVSALNERYDQVLTTLP